MPANDRQMLSQVAKQVMDDINKTYTNVGSPLIPFSQAYVVQRCLARMVVVSFNFEGDDEALMQRLKLDIRLLSSVEFNSDMLSIWLNLLRQHKNSPSYLIRAVQDFYQFTYREYAGTEKIPLCEVTLQMMAYYFMTGRLTALQMPWRLHLVSMNAKSLLQFSHTQTAQKIYMHAAFGVVGELSVIAERIDGMLCRPSYSEEFLLAQIKEYAQAKVDSKKPPTLGEKLQVLQGAMRPARMKFDVASYQEVHLPDGRTFDVVGGKRRPAHHEEIQSCFEGVSSYYPAGRLPPLILTSSLVLTGLPNDIGCHVGVCCAPFSKEGGPLEKLK